MCWNKVVTAGVFGLSAGWGTGLILSVASPYQSWRTKWVIIGSAAILAAAYRRRYIRIDTKLFTSEIPPLELNTGAAGAGGFLIGAILP